MKPDGVCLLASKLYYFGVGGSLMEFKDFIKKNYASELEISTAKFINTKKSNNREISKIIKKKKWLKIIKINWWFKS